MSWNKSVTRAVKWFRPVELKIPENSVRKGGLGGLRKIKVKPTRGSTFKSYHWKGWQNMNRGGLDWPDTNQRQEASNGKGALETSLVSSYSGFESRDSRKTSSMPQKEQSENCFWPAVKVDYKLSDRHFCQIYRSHFVVRLQRPSLPNWIWGNSPWLCSFRYWCDVRHKLIRGVNSKKAVLCLTTISKKSLLFTWCCVSEVVWSNPPWGCWLKNTTLIRWFAGSVMLAFTPELPIAAKSHVVTPQTSAPKRSWSKVWVRKKIFISAFTCAHWLTE